MKPKRKRNNLLLAAISLTLTAPSAFAVAHYWDNNEGTTGFGNAGGTWGTSVFWNTASSGLGIPAVTLITTSDAANFGTDTTALGGGTITVNGTVNAASLRFGSRTTNAVTLSGGIINLADTTSIHVGAGNVTHIITSEITGAATSLTKTGNTLRLDANNSYTGSTIISTGTLILNNSAVLGGNNPGTNGTSSISMGANSTLQSNYAPADAGVTDSFIYAPITLTAAGTNNFRIGNGSSTSPPESVRFNINGAIGGTAGANVVFGNTTATRNNADSIIVLGAASTYNGNTTIHAGNTANRINVISGAVNALPASTVLSFDTVGGSGSGRTTQFDLAGNNQTLAGLKNGGTVASLRNIRVTSATAATLTINGASDSTFGGANGSQNAQIAGAIALTKDGAGTFTLAAGSGNAFTGDTKVLGGILVLGNTNSIQNSTLDTASSIAGDNANGLRTAVTTLRIGGLSGNKDFADVFTSTTGGYNGLTNLTLNPLSAVNASYAADIGDGAGGMTLTKTGAGTQTITAAQTYTGGTSVSSGILSLGGTGTLGASGTDLTLSGGSLDMGTTSQTVGAVSVTAAATISNGSLTGTSYAASNASGTAVISANLLANGAAGFDKTGAGTVTLSGTNTYTGNTTITAGVIETALADNLAGYTDAGKVVFNGGRLNIETGDGTTTGWTAAQVATLLSNATKTSGTLGVSVTNGDVTETAFDFGGLNLVKSGASTLTLTQAHTLGATTIVNGGGTVKITDAGALGSGDVSILTAGTSTGTLELALTGTNSITNTFNGFNSANTLAGGGIAQIVNTLGTNTVTSNLTITNTGGNGLNVESNGGLLTLSGTITHTIASGRTLSLGGSGDGVVSGAINNNSTGNVTLGLNKTGAGTWTLSSGSSTYTGATNINGGSLIINGAVASTSVVVNSSLGGSGSASAATISGSGSVNPGNSPGIFTASAANPSGGLDFNFELSAEGTDPTWSNATASVNDVLRLTSATPFTASLDATNQITLYLGIPSLTEGDVFTGGFFTDNSADFLASIDSAAFRYFLADASGSEAYNGNNYTEYTGPLGFSRSTVLVGSADFEGGTVTEGYVTQFTVVPEPSAALLGGLGVLLLLRRRRK